MPIREVIKPTLYAYIRLSFLNNIICILFGSFSTYELKNNFSTWRVIKNKLFMNNNECVKFPNKFTVLGNDKYFVKVLK